MVAFPDVAKNKVQDWLAMPGHWQEAVELKLGEWSYEGFIKTVLKLNRFESGFVEIEGIRFKFLRGQSQGRIPYVMLHGFADSKESLIPLAAALPRQFYPVLLDLPGHGESGVAPIEGLSVMSMLEMVRKAILAMGIERCHLLGHSLGAIIAGFTAHEYPEMVESVVLLNPGGPSGLGPEVLAALDEGRNPITPKNLEEFEAFMDFATARKLPFPRFFNRYLAHKWTRRMDVLEQYFHAMFVENLDEQLPKDLTPIHMPGMLVVGMGDKVVNVEDRRFYQEMMPDLEMVRFPDLGHASHLENLPHLLLKLHSFLRRHTTQ